MLLILFQRQFVPEADLGVGLVHQGYLLVLPLETALVNNSRSDLLMRSVADKINEVLLVVGVKSPKLHR